MEASIHNLEYETALSLVRTELKTVYMYIKGKVSLCLF